MPVINKLLTATLPRQDDPNAISKEMILPKIVRIEVGSIDKVTEGSDASNPGFLSPDLADVAGNMDIANELPAVGQKVARKIFGGSIFRGNVVEVSEPQVSNTSLFELNANDYCCCSVRVRTRISRSSLMERELKWMVKN